MAYRLKVTSDPFRGLRHTGTTQPEVSPKEVARALGAQAVRTTAGVSGSPPSLQAIRADIAGRLLSTGGRPSLVGATLRQKIPLTPADWASLEQIARRLSEPAHRLTAGQVASALIHERLARFGGNE